MSRLVVVSLWFQLIWLLAVFGQYHLQWVTLIFSLVTLLCSAINDQRNIGKIIILSLCGIALDWLNSLAGLLVFKSSLIPVWLGALWLAFIWYARQWLPYLGKYPKAGIVFVVGIGGSMSYWAGYRFSAVEFSFPLGWSLIALAAQWCGVAWLIMRVFTNEINIANSHIITRHKS